MYWTELNTDGHCSYSPDGNFIITDTYPNRKRIASVYLCTEEDNHSRRIARVFMPFRYDNDCRCDLHPRWNHMGDKICIDSVHEGKRGLYVVGLVQDLHTKIEDEYRYQHKTSDIDTDAIRKKVDQFEYVSFDIFDTLIKRDVPSPSDVFVLVQRRFEQETGVYIDNFKEIRRQAENEARKKSVEPEIYIDDIYKCMHLTDQGVDKDILKKMEIEIELALCCANKPIQNIYNYCIEHGKKILIISNMYLPQGVVEEMLSNVGYTNYQKLYLSSTCKLKKSDGRLFDFALKEQGINVSQLIHIGDSWKVDYLQAKKRGIAAIHISKHLNYLSHNGAQVEEEDKFNNACIRSFVNNHMNLQRNDYYRFGYESFGLLLYGFNEWMVKDMHEKNITDVFFFSRDGHVIKRAFDIQHKNSNIISHYFYVSRRSLRVPQLWLNPEYEQVIEVFPLAKLLTVGTFIQNLGLDPKDYEEQMLIKGLTSETVLKKSELPTNTVIREFYESIKLDVIKHSKEECNIFIDYMKQNGFKGKIAVVDIGWHGSLQYFIQQMADKLSLDLEMHGYYIGLATQAKRQIDIKGYVIDKGSKTNSCDAWKPFNGLVENLFLAQEGSTEKFERLSNGTIVPVLYPYEYADSDGNMEWEAVKVGNIQDGAVDFVADIAASGVIGFLNYSSTTAFSNINETGIHPRKQDLDLFADFRFLEEQVDYLAKPRSLIYYAIHPKHLKKDIGFCRWKIGFMKMLFMIPLPYVKMYDVLRNMAGENK
jgi:predicted HAD superfamily hydrolase